MSHRINSDLAIALANNIFQGKDPGASGTIVTDNRALTIVEVTTATGETRTLESADDLNVGTLVLVTLASDGGDLTISTSSDDTDVVLADVGDAALFVVVADDDASTKEWRTLLRSDYIDAVATLETEVAALEADVQGAFVVGIPFTNFRVHDGFNTNLPATAGTDDLGVTTPTPGTDAPEMVTAASAASLTQEGLAVVRVPENYQAGSALSIVIPWTRSNAAEVSSDLDLLVYRTAAPTVDINSTDAVDINGAASGTATFVLTPTNIVPGEELLINVIVVNDDTAGSGSAQELTSMSFSYSV